MPSEADLANHLAYLAVDLSLSASTVRVRRSAIASTLAQMGVRGVGGSAWVADVIRGVSQREARVPRRVPAWDLGVVLSFLQGSRFEPLSSAPLARVCVKTAFLVLLASGRRASEVTALSGLDSDVALEADGSMSLHFLPEFRAKNQRPGDRSPVILIKPLAWILASDDPDLVNCPVRCLQVYRRRSRRLRALSQRQLFLSLNCDYRRDIRPTTISRWVATLIRDAYKALGETEGGGAAGAWLPLSNTRVHETRAWASSLAASRSTSLADVLEAAYWRSESVFTSHYLRDVARRREDGAWALPSLVAAQTLVPARR
jgi:hypothetical protein